MIDSEVCYDIRKINNKAYGSVFAPIMKFELDHSILTCRKYGPVVKGT